MVSLHIYVGYGDMSDLLRICRFSGRKIFIMYRKPFWSVKTVYKGFFFEGQRKNQSWQHRKPNHPIP